MSNTPTHSTATTIVLVDPTSPDGESALAMIHAAETHVAIVVLLSGRHSSALRELAHAEHVSVVDAGWQYLDQVHERIQRPGLTIETVLATGPNTAAELAVIARERDAGRIIVPSSVERADRRAIERLRGEVAGSVDVADLLAVG